MKADTSLIDFSPSLHSLRIAVSDADYRVLLWGSGAIPVLLLHGFTGRGDVWLRPTQDLMEIATFAAPDLLGHGRTQSPHEPQRFTIQHAADDLAKILDHLRVDRAVVHGYSMGGRLALYFALAHPSRVTALSLESASPGLVSAAEREARSAADDALAERITNDGIDAFVTFWESTPLFEAQVRRLSDEAFTRQREIRRSQRATGLSASLRGMGTGTQPSLWERLKEIDVHVQLVSGQRDQKFGAIAQAMSAHIAHVRHIDVPNAGHAIHIENPENWRAEMRTLVSFVERQRAYNP